MKPKLAAKRYLSAMMGSSLGYLASVFGVTFIHDKFVDGSVPAILISLIPAFFVGLMVWSLWRYLREMDEVAYHYLTRSMLLAMFGVLVLSGGWGLAELFNDNLPRVPVFFVFPIFFLGYGLISTFKFKQCA